MFKQPINQTTSTTFFLPSFRFRAIAPSRFSAKQSYGYSQNLKQIQQKRKRVVVQKMSTSSLQLIPALAPFEPSLLGGLTLGVLVASKLILNGRVLGVSGEVKGALLGNKQRLFFITGLLIGGAALAHYNIIPGGFETIPPNSSILCLISGLLVGFGTCIGNGCTSGHGICGNARLSPRSFVATLTFMGAGIATALLTKSADTFQLPRGIFFPDVPSPEIVAFGKTVLAASIGLFGILSLFASTIRQSGTVNASRDLQTKSMQKLSILEQVSEFSIGLLFAAGLYVSGMTKPSNVIAFLSLQNPSLMFVMGGALLVATPVYQYVQRLSRSTKCTPLLTEKYMIPQAAAIDATLLVGAALFGIGWGLSGICPGPGLVALSAVRQLDNLIFIGALIVGMLVASGRGVSA